SSPWAARPICACSIRTPSGSCGRMPCSAAARTRLSSAGNSPARRAIPWWADGWFTAMPAESVRQARLLGGTPVTGGWQLLRLHLPELQGRLRLGQRLRITTATGSLEAYVYYLAAD